MELRGAGADLWELVIAQRLDETLKICPRRRVGRGPRNVFAAAKVRRF